MNSPPFDEETFLRFFRTLDERQARLCAAERALALGWGGITRLARVTGLAHRTIRKGIGEVRSAASLEAGRRRRAGGGRKRAEVREPALLPTLQELVAASTAGSPEAARRWTSTSKAKLAAALAARGHGVAPNTVGRLLRALDYRLQANRKDKEGRSPPERNAQFRYLTAQARRARARGQPVLSVDTKKKELVGNFKNGGRTWRPTGDPIRVQVHDFPSLAMGKAIPYGIYDVGHNRGFVKRPGGTRHQSRHARLRRREYPALVGVRGGRALPHDQGAAHPRRQRGQQQCPQPALEGPAAGTGR